MEGHKKFEDDKSPIIPIYKRANTELARRSIKQAARTAANVELDKRIKQGYKNIKQAARTIMAASWIALIFGILRDFQVSCGALYDVTRAFRYTDFPGIYDTLGALYWSEIWAPIVAVLFARVAPVVFRQAKQARSFPCGAHIVLPILCIIGAIGPFILLVRTCLCVKWNAMLTVSPWDFRNKTGMPVEVKVALESSFVNSMCTALIFETFLIVSSAIIVLANILSISHILCYFFCSKLSNDTDVSKKATPQVSIITNGMVKVPEIPAGVQAVLVHPPSTRLPRF